MQLDGTPDVELVACIGGWAEALW